MKHTGNGRHQLRLWASILVLIGVHWNVNTGWRQQGRLHDLAHSSSLRYFSTKGDCKPENVHLNPTSNVDLASHRINMTVSFTVPRGCQQNWDPMVHYGSDSHNFTAVETESFEFSFSNYIRSFQSSRIYHTVLPDIHAGSQSYWYQVKMVPRVEEEMLSESPIFHFESAPLPRQPVRLALVADWGTSYEAGLTMQGMMNVKSGRHGDWEGEKPPLSAVIVAGDISYANAHLPSWETFLNQMEPLFSSTPLLMAAGNHEIECNRHNFEVFQAYEHYFRVPNRIASPVDRRPIPRQVSDCTHPAEFETIYNYGNSFYSYKHGMLHIIVLNSYTNTTRGSKQFVWLQEEFETRLDRDLTPWVLVVFHCPLHTTFKGHNDEENPKLMMQYMEPLFVEHEVNFVLSGHNHAYVRSHPMAGSSRRSHDAAPIYLTVGTGGNSHSGKALHPGQPETWVAHRDNTEYGFGELTIVNATHSYFRRVLNRGDAANPAARDQVWLKNYHRSPVSTNVQYPKW